MILPFPGPVRYKTKQQTDIYIHNKKNKPKEKNSLDAFKL